MPSHRLLAALLALVASLSAAAQDERGDPACSVAPRASAAAPSAAGLTLPAAYAAQWGELANAFPFGTSQMRYQQVFLGSEIPGSVSVAGLGFREDDQGNRASGGVADLTVKLGLTTFDHSTLGLASNFDANYDVSGSTTVLNGRVNLPTLSGQNTNLATFAVHLPCDVPYMLAPLAGQNLLLEVVNRGSDNTGFYDKVNANASVGTTTRIWATSATATTAGRGIRNDGLVLCLVRAGTCAAPAFASFGAGCQGSNGVPQHGAATLPALGSTHTLTLGTARPSTQAVLFADVQRATWGGVPLPLPLDFLGAVGCTLYVPGTLQVPVATDMLGNASVSLPVPNYASACGVRLFSQFIVVDPINNLNLVTTNGAESRLGR